MLRMAKVEGFVDNCGEVKIIGHGPDKTPRGMAAMIQYPQLYQCKGTVYFIRADVPWWKRLVFVTVGAVGEGIPWYLRDKHGYPIEFLANRERFYRWTRIVCQNIRKVVR